MMSDREELAYRFAHQEETRQAAIDELVEVTERRKAFDELRDLTADMEMGP